MVLSICKHWRYVCIFVIMWFSDRFASFKGLMMKIIFDSCMVVRVFPSPAKPSRLYVDLIDLDTGNKFEFSTETMPPADLHKITKVPGRFEGQFETYIFTKDNVQAMKFKAIVGSFTAAGSEGKKAS